MKEKPDKLYLKSGEGNGVVSPEDIYLLTTSALQLVFFLLSFSLILYKVKMNLSRQLVIVLCAYLLCFIARFTLDLIKVIKSLDNLNNDYNQDKLVITMKILNSFGRKLSKIAVIYFVFQAKEVQIKLQAQTIEDYQTKMKKYNKFYLLIIALFICFETWTFAYDVLEDIQVLKTYQDNTKDILLYLDIVSTLCTIIIIMIVSIVFINILVFYIQTRKKQQNKNYVARSNPIQVEEREGYDFKSLIRCKCFQEMTLKQKCVVWYILVTLLFFTTQQLTKIVDIVLGYKQQRLDIFLNVRLEWALNMTFDFLVSSGFLYISLSLGLHALRMKNNPQKSSTNSKFFTNETSEVKKILAGTKTESLGRSVQPLQTNGDSSEQIIQQSAKHKSSINLDNLEDSQSSIERENIPSSLKHFKVTYRKESEKAKVTNDKNHDPKSAFEEDVFLIHQKEVSSYSNTQSNNYFSYNRNNLQAYLQSIFDQELL